MHWCQIPATSFTVEAQSYSTDALQVTPQLAELYVGLSLPISVEFYGCHVSAVPQNATEFIEIPWRGVKFHAM